MTRRSRTEEKNSVNDNTWRNLSAMLGVACVVLIIAAGALLATSGGSATATQTAGIVANATPSASSSPVDSGSPAPSASASGHNGLTVWFTGLS